MKINLTKWLIESNRPKHIVAGIGIFIVILAVCIVLGVIFLKSCVVSLIATTIVAVAVDYKDKLWGGRFDYLDVLATILVPAIITVIALIL